MKHILLPDGCSGRRLVFYLSMEEYVAANLDRIAGEGGEAFFMWQVAPTVIFGRNQVMEAETEPAARIMFYLHLTQMRFRT